MLDKSIGSFTPRRFPESRELRTGESISHPGKRGCCLPCEPSSLRRQRDLESDGQSPDGSGEGKNSAIVQNDRAAASFQAAACLGWYATTSALCRSRRLASGMEASWPRPTACIITLPIAVASIGPATTVRLHASAVIWQSRWFCTPHPRFGSHPVDCPGVLPAIPGRLDTAASGFPGSFWRSLLDPQAPLGRSLGSRTGSPRPCWRGLRSGRHRD